jgi:hypothetical protein
MGWVCWVLYRDLDVAVRKVLDPAKQGMLEGPPKKQPEGGALHDVCMYHKRYVAHAHGEVLGAPKGPVGRPIGTLHLKQAVRIDGSSDFPG